MTLLPATTPRRRAFGWLVAFLSLAVAANCLPALGQQGKKDDKKDEKKDDKDKKDEKKEARKKDEPLLALQGHKDWVNRVVFSHDGKYVATASRDRTVKIWDA